MFSFIFFFISENTAENIAVKVAGNEWIGSVLVDAIRYYSLQGEPLAICFVFDIKDTRFSNLHDRDFPLINEKWEKGKKGYVVVSLDKRYPPIIELSNTLPPRKVNLRDVLNRFPGYGFLRYIYFSPLSEWFEIVKGRDTLYINSYSLKNETKKVKKLKNSTRLLRFEEDKRWNNLKRASFVTVDEGYVEDVPYAFWSYGCSPTASTMIMAYWDERGYGRLVDYYYDRWDNVEKENDYNLHNIHRELAIGMHTDSLYSGGTGIHNIAPGHLYAANEVNGYKFDSYTSPRGNSSNAWNFKMIKEEIDEERPVHWAVLNYNYHGIRINHSVCAVGYKIDDAGDTLIRVHNTWTTGEPLWALHTPGSYSYVYPVHPGGEEEQNVRMISPTGGELFFEGLYYPIIWETQGEGINRVVISKIDIEHSGNNWVFDWVILKEMENSGMYIWKAEGRGDCRFQVEIYKGTKLFASDGSFLKSSVEEKPDEYILLHYPFSRSIYSIASIGEKIVVAGGSNGLFIGEVKDSVIYPIGTIDTINVNELTTYLDLLYYHNKDLIIKAKKDNLLLPIANIRLSSSPRAMQARKDRVLVLTKKYSIYLLNNQLEKLDSIIIPKAYSMDMVGDTLYVATLNDTVFVLYAGDSLLIMDTIPVGVPGISIKKYKGYIFIAASAEGLRMFDLKGKELCSLDDERILKIDIIDGYLYAGGAGFFKVFSLENLPQLKEVHTFKVSTVISDFAKKDNYLLVGDRKNLFGFPFLYTGFQEEPFITQKIQKKSLIITNLSRFMQELESEDELIIYGVDGRIIYRGDKSITSLPAGVYYVGFKNKQKLKKLVVLKKN